MKTNQKSRLKEWASKLTERQAKAALVQLVEEALEYEMLSYWDDSLAPYWANTGDPLVPRQKTHPDD